MPTTRGEQLSALWHCYAWCMILSVVCHWIRDLVYTAPNQAIEAADIFLLWPNLSATSGSLTRSMVAGSLLASFWFLAVVQAPLLEELLFRSWLSTRGKALVFGPALAAIGCLFFWGFGSHPLVVWALSGLLGLLLYSMLRNRTEGFRAAPMSVWVMGLLANLIFGALHLKNIQVLPENMLVWPILILPHTVAGITLVFARLKVGILGAVVLHAVHNAFFLITEPSSSSAGVNASISILAIVHLACLAMVVSGDVRELVLSRE